MYHRTSKLSCCFFSYVKGQIATDTALCGPRREKTCLPGFANNKGADQPAHPRRLISAFVILFLESTISRHATSEISIFQLVSVAEETGLNLVFSVPEDRFCRVEAHIVKCL